MIDEFEDMINEYEIGDPDLLADEPADPQIVFIYSKPNKSDRKPVEVVSRHAAGDGEPFERITLRDGDQVRCYRLVDGCRLGRTDWRLDL